MPKCIKCGEKIPLMEIDLLSLNRNKTCKLCLDIEMEKTTNSIKNIEKKSLYLCYICGWSATIQSTCEHCKKMICQSHSHYISGKRYCSECSKNRKYPQPTQTDSANKIEQPKSRLINCPDCTKQVSRRAIVCPNCGCPIKDIAGEIDKIPVSSEVEQVASISNQSTTNVPKCPTCQSININRISLKNKVGSAVLVGVFALGKISKTFVCNSCGYKW